MFDEFFDEFFDRLDQQLDATHYSGEDGFTAFQENMSEDMDSIIELLTAFLGF